jgi:hypothetical protein
MEYESLLRVQLPEDLPRFSARAKRNVSGQRLRPRSRVPEAWRGPPHNKLYGAGPVDSRLIKFNLKLSV